MVTNLMQSYVLPEAGQVEVLKVKVQKNICTHKFNYEFYFIVFLCSTFFTNIACLHIFL